MRKRRLIPAAISVGVLALSLASCSNQTIRDLKGIPIENPDRVAVVVNVDQFPNIVVMCVHGAGFATTTREAAGAITHVQEWDASNDGWCKTAASPAPPAK